MSHLSEISKNSKKKTYNIQYNIKRSSFLYSTQKSYIRKLMSYSCKTFAVRKLE